MWKYFDAYIYALFVSIHLCRAHNYNLSIEVIAKLAFVQDEMIPYYRLEVFAVLASQIVGDNHYLVLWKTRVYSTIETPTILGAVGMQYGREELGHFIPPKGFIRV